MLNNLLTTIVTKLGLPKAVQDVVIHVVLVFLAAFGAQVSGAWFGKFTWPTLVALAVSGAAAGASAAVHYLVGLIPSGPTGVGSPASPPSKPAAPRKTASTK